MQSKIYNRIKNSSGDIAVEIDRKLSHFFSLCCDRVVVERLACFYDPESYAGGSLWLLAGSTIPDWSWVRSETKGSTWSSRLGVGRGLFSEFAKRGMCRFLED